MRLQQLTQRWPVHPSSSGWNTTGSGDACQLCHSTCCEILKNSMWGFFVGWCFIGKTYMCIYIIDCCMACVKNLQKPARALLWCEALVVRLFCTTAPIKPIQSLWNDSTCIIFKEKSLYLWSIEQTCEPQQENVGYLPSMWLFVLVSLSRSKTFHKMGWKLPSR